MKYGLELQRHIFAPWRLSYVAYDVLKQELKSRQLDHGWTKTDEADFIQLLDNELSKVYDFVNAKLSEVDARILYCERTVQTLQKNSSMTDTNASWSLMDEALTEILFDVNDLSRFTRVNFTAIQKILKKHDKWTSLNLKCQYVQKLRDKPLDKQRFDVSIVYISALLTICRNKGKQHPSNAVAGGDQNAFERATAKYWVHPDNVTEVKAIIMLHLPVLVYNKDKKYEPSDAAISSVYFDNTNFNLYTSRLQRDEGAEAIRFRWYGPTESNSIYIERKTHHAAWLNGTSVKDRFRLEEHQVTSFRTGDLTPSEIANNIRQNNTKKLMADHVQFIAHGIQTSLLEKKLDPVLRILYNRTAFQVPDDQKLRVSLDTDLTFIREDHLDGQLRRSHQHQGSEDWRRRDVGTDPRAQQVSDNDVLRFPYAVLETKLQTHLGQEPPAWLTSLVESHLVHEVPRFSKYLHGIAHFHSERLPLLPWWLSKVDVDIRKPRAEHVGLTRSKSFKPLIDGRYRREMIEGNGGRHLQAVVKNSSDLTEKEQGPYEPHVALSIQGDDVRAKAVVLLLQPQRYKLFSTDKVSQWASRWWGDSRKGPSNSNNEGTDFNLYRRQKVKVRVEPKVFFANERTFISWLQFCALLLTVALNLLNFGDRISRAVGGCFMCIAAVVAIYALYRFEKRAWMINRRIDGRYDDLWGPAVLCLLLVIALIVNFYLRFK